MKSNHLAGPACRGLHWLRHVPSFGLLLFALASSCGKSGPTAPVDGQFPVLGGLVINGGAAFTTVRNVTIGLSASDDLGVTEMRISEDPDFAGEVWRGYSASMAFDLSAGDEAKTVYAQVRDASGKVSGTAEGEIILAENSSVVHLREVPLPAEGGGETITLELFIVQAVDLVSATFKLSFDPARLEATAIEVSSLEGHILRSTGANLIVANRDIDNAGGEILVAALAQQSGFTGVSGDGPFARVTFRTLSSAPFGIRFVHDDWTRLYEYRLGEFPAVVTDVFFIDQEVVR